MKLLLLSIITLLASAHNAHAGIFNSESMTLDNGLQVVVIPNHRAPIVHHMLWYKVGSAQEIEKKSGVAHFLEHLLFKGTNHPDRPLKPGEFSQKIKKLGGNDNAFTSKDYTAYYETVSKKHLKTVMQMEADRMRHSMPPAEHVLSERKVVIEERNQRIENNPQAKFFEKITNILFPNHPYRRPVIGLGDEIQKMNHDDTKLFYDTWYHPNNAILIISGDVTLSDIKDDIIEIYGPLEKKAIPDKLFNNISTRISGITISSKDELVKQPLFVRAYRAPSYSQMKSTSLALQVLTNVLDGGANTPLYKKLVVDDKKAVNISLSYSANQLDSSSIWITATPSEGTTIKELEDSIETLLTNLIKEGITEEAVNEAKKRMQHAAIFARDSLSSPANIFGRALTTGSSVDDVENWDKQIENVSTSQVQHVLETYLNHNSKRTYWEEDEGKKYSYVSGYVTGHLLPKKEDEKQNNQQGDTK